MSQQAGPLSSAVPGFAAQWLPSQQHAGSAVLTHGLATPRHVGSSRTRDRTHIPCIGRWISTVGPPGMSSPSFSKSRFSDYNLLIWSFLSEFWIWHPSIFWIPCFLKSHHLIEDTCIQWVVFFFLAVSNILFLSFSSLTMICLPVALFEFILVYLSSCICRLMFFIHLEHLDHYFFNILRPYLFLSTCLSQVYIPFVM